nr:MAG TPA: hypothetical protein [Caudoviricetes sp.]
MKYMANGGYPERTIPCQVLFNKQERCNDYPFREYTHYLYVSGSA